MNDGIKELMQRTDITFSKDELRDLILNAMVNTNTIEELLILKWHLGKAFYPSVIDVKNDNTSFFKNIERISYNNALKNKEYIIEDLLGGISLSKIKDQYNTTREALNRLIINYLNTVNYQEKILSRIEVFNEPFVPQHDRDFLIAKAAIKMFIDNGCYTSTKAYKKFACPIYQTFKYLNILEVQKHPLYIEYSLLNKKELSTNTTNVDNRTHRKEKEVREKKINKVSSFSYEKILDILTNHNSEEFINYCLYYSFDSSVLKELLRDNKNLRFELAKSSDKEMIINIYDEYVSRYKVIIKSVIRDIIVLSKDKFNKPLDLYKYYEKTSFNLKILARLAESFSDIKNNMLILQYFNRFPSVFEEVTRSDLSAIKQKGVISSCKDSISFSYGEFNRALSNIEEKGMPLVKGVLYGSIKRQKELKDTKVMKKKL